MKLCDVRQQLTGGKWACSHPADMAGSSPDSTALHTSPSNQAVTETNVPTLSALHHFTFDQNLAVFSPFSDTLLHYGTSPQHRARRMDTSPAFIFIGCKYFRSRTKVNTGQFDGAQSHTVSASCVIIVEALQPNWALRKCMRRCWVSFW